MVTESEQSLEEEEYWLEVRAERESQQTERDLRVMDDNSSVDGMEGVTESDDYGSSGDQDSEIEFETEPGDQDSNSELEAEIEPAGTELEDTSSNIAQSFTPGNIDHYPSMNDPVNDSTRGNEYTEGDTAEAPREGRRERKPKKMFTYNTLGNPSVCKVQGTWV